MIVNADRLALAPVHNKAGARGEEALLFLEKKKQKNFLSSGACLFDGLRPISRVGNAVP
jgi:hypothetical protein